VDGELSSVLSFPALEEVPAFPDLTIFFLGGMFERVERVRGPRRLPNHPGLYSQTGM